MRSSLFLACAALIGVMPAAGRAASDPPGGDAPELEEIIVTAQKRAEKAQDVPIPMNVLGAAALERIGFTDITDLVKEVPALQLQPFNYSSSVVDLRIRGVGSLNTISVSNDPAVGLYVDDVYVARSAGIVMDMGDVERIEVLRGPQGTLYGRNTIGGAVKFISAKPTGTFGVNGSFDFGNFGHARALINVNLPKFAEFSLKLSYLRSGFDGWVKNPGAGRDFGRRDREGIRAALRWTPDPDMTVDYVFDRGTQDGTANFFQNGFPRKRTSPPIATAMRDDFTASGHALTIDWRTGANISLKSITAFRKIGTNAVTDTAGAFFSLPITGYTAVHQKQFSQELLLTGDVPDASVRYTLGALFFKESGRTRFGIATGFPTPFFFLDPGRARNVAAGMYANVTWTPPLPGRRLDITIGARASYDEREAAGGVTAFSRASTHSSSFDPSLTLDYRWSDDIHSYVKISRGYRTGGFSLFDEDLSAFDPEHIVSYEAGLKSTLFDKRLLFNINAFHNDYSDIQVSDIVQTPNCPFGCASTVNGGSADFDGFEGEVEVRPAAGLRLQGNLAYLHTSGSVIFLNAPRWSYTVGGEYSFPLASLGTFSALINYAYSGTQVSSTTGAIAFLNNRRGLLNARLSLSDIDIGGVRTNIALWANNLTDKDYTVYANSGALIFGEPRTYGLTLRLVY
ncbi:TonB-dependent receptor [Sphingomonas colocasiae]|uniref:TonB-dependent receptor n=1 Tax=Sphingomonas colocasiae TaxID=1848973 RepID=A0ABS7PVJ9_9SPHN|nr:TonB-dependent receptor [Sphingomonas colocasiae]MBY8825228.1 TonB-dependent receptor [Sphingomonas colocasiae]